MNRFEVDLAAIEHNVRVIRKSIGLSTGAASSLTVATSYCG